MKTISPVTFSLIILMSSLIGIINASSLSGLPLLNAYAAKHGTVKLRSDSYSGGSYYAYVDFQYLYSEDSDDAYISPSSSTGKMMIGLYTSNTWLSYSCLGFTYYDCSSNSCYKTSSSASESLPYFNATGYYASSTDVYLDYSDWYLYTSAAIASSCNSTGNNWYGQSRTGIVGMGVGNGASSNFRSRNLFTVYIDPTSQTGELEFQVDSSKKANSYSDLTFTADSNWHVNLGSSAYFQLTSSGTYSYSSYYYAYFSYATMIFDLDTPYIGLPYSGYQKFITSFQSAAGVSCTSDLSYPTCYYYGKMSDLPTISLYGQSETISIPPQVYIEYGFTYSSGQYLSTINLNIRALGSSLSGINYVTPAYDNTIIMGSSFMSYYYTVFDDTMYTPQITLSVASTGSGLLWLWIMLGVFGFIVIVAMIGGCAKKAQARRATTGGNNATNAYGEPSYNEPLANNNQYVAPAYNNYSNDNYNQQTYGYNYNNQPVGNTQYQGYNPYNPN